MKSFNISTGVKQVLEPVLEKGTIMFAAILLQPTQ